MKINIREICSRVLRHPMLQGVNLEQAIQYAIDFTMINGFPGIYSDKEANVEIDDYKGDLPCDLIEIEQVVDCKSGVALRHMTSTLLPGCDWEKEMHELSFKTQGRVIWVSFKCGKIKLAYKAIEADDEGYPYLIDDPVFLKALEDYIKCQAFTILFDLGELNANVLTHAEQEYAWSAGRLHALYKMPSLSEAEAITRMWNTLLPREHSFAGRFEHGSDAEQWKTRY